MKDLQVPAVAQEEMVAAQALSVHRAVAVGLPLGLEAQAGQDSKALTVPLDNHKVTAAVAAVQPQMALLGVQGEQEPRPVLQTQR